MKNEKKEPAVNKSVTAKCSPGPVNGDIGDIIYCENTATPTYPIFSGESKPQK